MPHAEFPSGSACLCAAASAITARLFDKGYDDYFPLEIEFPVNSVEPRLSGQGYKQTYNNPKEYADDCSFTRFQGGMHYDFSLEPGSWMCTEANDFISKAEGKWCCLVLLSSSHTHLSFLLQILSIRQISLDR